jgi:hypothetical protein
LPDDVRVLQLGGELDLAAEAVDVEPGGEVGWQNLDDDLAVERDFGGDKDAAHAATAQLALDPVGVAECRLQASREVVHRRGERLAR